MIYQRTPFQSTIEAEDGLGGVWIVVGTRNSLTVSTYSANGVSVFTSRERQDYYDPGYQCIRVHGVYRGNACEDFVGESIFTWKSVVNEMYFIVVQGIEEFELSIFGEKRSTDCDNYSSFSATDCRNMHEAPRILVLLLLFYNSEYTRNILRLAAQLLETFSANLIHY
jgi:hypothetical protein